MAPDKSEEAVKYLRRKRRQLEKDARMEEKMEEQEGNRHGRDRPVVIKRRDGSDRRRNSGYLKNSSPEARYTCAKKRGTTGVILLVVVIIGLLAAGSFYIKKIQSYQKSENLVYEANIISGDLPGKTREERQRELDSIVEEGMLAMSINATPAGKISGTDQAINWLIENPSNQRKLIRVEVWKDDSGEKIYETGAIPPGNYVESAPLTVKLPPGQYSCTAKFFAYKEGNEDYIGQAAAQIILTLYE